MILFFKGIQFISESALLQQVVESSASLKTYPWLYLIIPWIHFLGGLFILIGLFPRWAAIAQLPIIAGALFFIAPQNRLVISHFELPMALLVLSLLLIVIIKGGGAFSWRNLIDQEKDIV